MNSPPWYPGANAGVSFGTTAPLNPVRGHFWWNGLTLFLFDGAVWVSVGGVASVTTPPSLSAPVNPVPGQQWFNGTTLFVWDGLAWVPVSQTKNTISSTAPPTPNPGDTWWDGAQFRIWDGSKWELVGPGATVGPVGTTTLQFAITQPTDITGITPINTWQVLAFTTTPQTDLQGAFDPVTKRYTPKKAGQYFFEARGHSSAANDGIVVVKNDTGTFSGLQTETVVGIDNAKLAGWLFVAGITPMNGTSDFVRMFVMTGSGTWANAGQNMVFGGYLLP